MKKTKQDLLNYLHEIMATAGQSAWKQGDKTGDVKRLYTLMDVLSKEWYDTGKSPLEEDNIEFLAKALDNCGLLNTAEDVRLRKYII